MGLFPDAFAPTAVADHRAVVRHPAGMVVCSGGLGSGGVFDRLHRFGRDRRAVGGAAGAHPRRRWRCGSGRHPDRPPPGCRGFRHRPPEQTSRAHRSGGRPRRISPRRARWISSTPSSAPPMGRAWTSCSTASAEISSMLRCNCCPAGAVSSKSARPTSAWPATSPQPIPESTIRPTTWPARQRNPSSRHGRP